MIHWANVVQQSIHNAAAPRSAGSSEVLHTMVHLAVYDAVVAVEGGSEPFAAYIPATRTADVKAAVATAAYADGAGTGGPVAARVSRTGISALSRRRFPRAGPKRKASASAGSRPRRC